MNGILPSPRAFRIPALLGLVLGFALSASAAWYWPFDFDPDSTNKPPRLHRLLEKANDYIELAEDNALEGEGDKAIENYRLALAELDRVEDENPDRAETPEFAPLRNKRATCTAAIDAIRFAQINQNVRAVALTDTKALERKWRRKHGLMTPEDEVEERKEKAREKARKEKRETDARDEDAASFRKPEEKAAKPATKGSPTFEERLGTALDEVRRQDYAAADLLLADLEEERPDNLNVLLLHAAAQMGLEHDHAARRTLEKAVRVHPKSYLPHYTLASLSLKLGEAPSEAKAHYERGRALGGPANEALEKRFK